MSKRWWPLLLCVTFLALASAQERPTAVGHAALIEIDGAIGPATTGYFEKASRQAVSDGASVIVLRIDTPGGLDGATRDIVRTILNSPIPVIGYVAPGGARAASAGTYILYACHVAAMAPATHLGSATPVPIGGRPFPGGDRGDGPAADKDDGPGPRADPSDQKDAARSGDAMQNKLLGDAVAYIRGLAERRGRNADWAERAVREGVSASSREALELGVIDLISPDSQALLKDVDGRKVLMAGGEQTLATAGIGMRDYAPDWRMRFLAVLTNPAVAYFLLLAGIYGLLLEGYNPGAILPGVMGAICLLLGLFAFQLLPVNYVGFALILLGIVLIVAESLLPSFGVLGFGGIAAFVFGSILLLDIDVPGYRTNMGIVAGIATVAVLAMAATVYLLARSRRVAVVTGEQALLQSELVVSEFGDGRGWARLKGERWRIQADQPLQPGDRVRVAAVDGLTLRVKKAHD
ncbi:NfeD family protein [Pseudoxanthomonas wuyuanensis]|uniref:Membrane-bound serine protease (ClpP class) n=1 Tax=Pseudoxanthomonas wuyuanensis TaxID=1073196 RepID=A0A286D976_9GAMM|nr:nodulation protein NfeD [Pseudoxanthomonas wuyuanensis]KAF1722073.1 serine protease [Pseudoxanthomonas wuyuanensis]SOD55183.1 membrane-bound serine protease (ClpP class) [Pseudoxanthomonas wuyuanensis]